MKLRGHHLLCTLAYKGLGYSNEFVENMNIIVDKLNSEENIIVELTNEVDDVCSKCPENDNNKCTTETKVVTMDNKTLNLLSLQKGKYTYKEIKQHINTNLNENVIHNICSNCEWYNKANCKQTILSKV